MRKNIQTHTVEKMSNLIFVFVVLCILQQSTSFSNTLNNPNNNGLRRKNPIVGDILTANTPALQPISRTDALHTVTDIRKRLRDLARHSKSKDSSVHFDTITKKLHELSQKSIVPHTVKPHDKFTPGYKKYDKKKRLNKTRKHRSKFLTSRSGVVGGSADATPQPLTYSSNADDDYKKGSGLIVQPKNLY